MIAIVEHQSKVHYDMSFRIAVRNFKERVHLSDILSDYIPNFEYIIVPLQDYSNDDIISKNDELSLVMLINKLKNLEEFKSLKNVPPEYFKNLETNTPEYLLKLISKIISVLLYRINIPQSEVETFTDQIMRREFSMLFDSFEAYDVQAVRKESKNETYLDTLKQWHKLAAKADSIEDFEIKIKEKN